MTSAVDNILETTDNNSNLEINRMEFKTKYFSCIRIFDGNPVELQYLIKAS